MIVKNIIRSHSPVVLTIKRFKASVARVPDTNFVLADEIGDKGILTLNRPDALNTENYEMIHKIHNCLEKWQNTKSMILIKSSNGGVFCAGGDLEAVIKAGDPNVLGRQIAKSYVTNHMIGNLKIPYVALIDGVTIGSGAGLSVPGKFRIATERTVYSMPEVMIGLVPDSGGSYFLPRLQGKLGYYLGLTASQLKGADVLHAGIATHYCNSAKIPNLEKTLINLKNSNEVESIINDFCLRPKMEFSLAKHLDQINESFDAPTMEDILSNLQKENSEWAKQTIKSLRSMSPTSLKITLRQFNLGANFSLGQCLQMEYRLILNLFGDNDCQEGIRALIIAKDNNPKWKPARVEDVSHKRVSYFFRPLPNDDELPIDVKLNLDL